MMFAMFFLGAFCVLIPAIAIVRNISVEDGDERKRLHKLLDEERTQHLSHRDRANYAEEAVRLMRTEVGQWNAVGGQLWAMLDDIDTLDDSCRNNHVRFREKVRSVQQKRFLLAADDGNNNLVWRHRQVGKL